METKKVIAILLGFIFMASIASAVPQVVTKNYQGHHVFDLQPYMGLPSCHIQTNYEAGACEYLYTCYAVLPKGSTSFDSAFQRECQENTTAAYNGQSVTVDYNFSPPLGYTFAVSYMIVKIKYNYNYTSEIWVKDSNIVEKEATEIIALCDQNYMLKGTTCYPAKSICVEHLNYQICDNPYQLYALDYGQGFDPTVGEHNCADRDLDRICDDVQSLYCSDCCPANGICDEDEARIANEWCADTKGQNWICDIVEPEAKFCPTDFNPVCDDVNSLTYPNSCYAEGAGLTTWLPGACEPDIVQCYADSDCGSPCDGVAGLCINYICTYVGECNPSQIQCSANTDCPSAPCVGPTKNCNTTNNTCYYEGKCILKPDTESNIWADLATLWLSFWQWIMSLFGWS